MQLTGWTVTLLNAPQLQALGWVLLQFLWQGTLIAAVTGIGLLFLRRRPRARYALGVGSMLWMLVTFLAALVVSWKAPQFAQRATIELPWNAAAIEMQSWGSALMQGLFAGMVSSTAMQRSLAWITEAESIQSGPLAAAPALVELHISSCAKVKPTPLKSGQRANSTCTNSSTMVPNCRS